MPVLSEIPWISDSLQGYDAAKTPPFSKEAFFCCPLSEILRISDSLGFFAAFSRGVTMEGAALQTTRQRDQSLWNPVLGDRVSIA